MFQLQEERNNNAGRAERRSRRETTLAARAVWRGQCFAQNAWERPRCHCCRSAWDSVPCTRSNAKSRCQIWSQADVVGGLTLGTTLTGTLIARAGEAEPDPTLTALGLQLDQRLRALILAAGYRHAVARHPTGGPDVTQLVLLESTYVVRADRSTLIFRARADNTLHSFGNPWRFRIRGEYRWVTRCMDPIS